MKNKRALFFVNTLSNGGAERVCVNMIDELLKENYKIDLILLNKECSYNVNSNVNILSLEINTKSKISKVFQLLLATKKVNKFINEHSDEYSLITSHLPMSNILTRFSKVNKKAIYVFHTSVTHYGKNRIFKIGFRLVFNNRKIVTVSKGLENECISEYKIDSKYIKTIYNPINQYKILEGIDEKIDIKCKYFLHIGRFSKEKRQDRMVDIFYKGKFYEKYKLLFCGVGELEEKVKQQVKDLEIENSVIFLGWQENVYKWIKNAEILISTSDYEAFPMNLIEAISCGTKVISSNCNYGPSEILLGKYEEFLADTENIDDYINKINKALTVYPKENNEIVNKCCARNVIDKYIKFYEEE